MFKPVEPKPNFPQKERQLLKDWQKKGVVKKYLQKNKKAKKTFSFIDGPITANNPMGVHHAWGRTYKDLWQRFFNLKGLAQRFQNGFDCQGLWVEVEVEKELNLKSKKEIENLVEGDKKASIDKFVKLCKERVYQYANLQTEQSERLGYFMDWQNSYFTMSDENNYMIWHFLKKCWQNGWIYQGKDSVPWCPRCQTAISQHEMLSEDYKEIIHQSIYFELPLIDKKREYLLVWTTTPWTIPANIAVAVDADLEYSLVQGNSGDYYWIAKELIEKIFAGDYKKIVKTVRGNELIGLKYRGPFDHLPAAKQVAKQNPKTFHTIVATDQHILAVVTSEGTGLVHTAVSAGSEDFKLGKKLGLPMIPVIADNADYLPGLGFLTGKNAKKNPRLILDYLLEREKKGENWVFKIHNYQHRYPACWRCKTELVWKVTDEWYIAMDRPSLKASDGKLSSKTLRERMIEVAKKIKWIPDFGLDRELDWLANMEDWLISKKNRFWGLALPIYPCKKCDHLQVIGSRQELKKKAVEGWSKFAGHTPHKPWIDEVKIKCFKCDSTVSRISDVGNPWLDAGIVPYSTISEGNQGEPLYLKDKKKWRVWFPADFITESFPGQFKNWFYSLIAMSTVLEYEEPFRTVLGFATLLGEDGRPMHKSWGNAIEFNQGADKIGVDVMRWMYSRQDPTNNLLFGYKKADQVRRQFYLIFWNAYRFFVEYANLDKIKIKKSKIKNTYQKLNILDEWIVNRVCWLINFVERELKNYNAKDPARAAEEFVLDLSTWYIRRSRDRVWVNSNDKKDKDNFYVTLHFVLTNLSIILSPFLPFVTDGIYTNLTGKESVHLATWPKIKGKVNQKLFADMDLVREIVELGHRLRKEKGLRVRQPLAKITVALPAEKKFALEKNIDQYEKLIQGELNVKTVKLEKKKRAEIKVNYVTKLTKELKMEGQAREIVREIQARRKKMGLKPNQFIFLTLPSYPEEYKEVIKKKVMAKRIKQGKKFAIQT